MRCVVLVPRLRYVSYWFLSLIGSCGASHFYFLFHSFEVLSQHFSEEFTRMGGGASEEEMGEGRRGDDMLREGDVISVV